MKLSVDDLRVFFDEPHVALGERLKAAAPSLAREDDREAARALADAGLFELVVPTGAIAGRTLDTRGLCLAREMLGYVSARADSIFAVQGLGTHAIVLAGTDEQRAELEAFARGAGIAAFASPSRMQAATSRRSHARGPTASGDRPTARSCSSNLGIADTRR